MQAEEENSNKLRDILDEIAGNLSGKAKKKGKTVGDWFKGGLLGGLKDIAKLPLDLMNTFMNGIFALPIVGGMFKFVASQLYSLLSWVGTKLGLKMPSFSGLLAKVLPTIGKLGKGAVAGAAGPPPPGYSGRRSW